MPNNYYDDYDEDSSSGGRDSLFLWTVFILLLVGLAFACWLGSFYIFGHPEQPKPYRILKKLGKLEPPRRFEVTAAPQGEFLSATKLFEKYSKLSRLELEQENARLLRNYVTNYRETNKLVPYIKGRFTILDTYKLTAANLFNSGVVAVAMSTDFPQVLIEHVYTAARENEASLEGMLSTGLEMSIERTLDLSAVIHVERVYDGRILLTVVPLLYGTYALKQGTGTFGLEPPAELNLPAGIPITTTQALQEGFKKYTAYRRQNPSSASEAPGPFASATPNPELVRLDAVPEGTKPPLTGPLPEMPVATPLPMTAKPKRSGATPPAVAALSPAATRPVATPLPVATPIPTAPAVPVASATPKTSPQGVPLTPFLASNPSPGLPSSSGTGWRTYPSGKVPPGRSVTPGEAATLSDQGALGERIYLRGQFLVTAAGDNRAVLRPQGAPESKRSTLSATRVIVEYPSGALPPAEGSSVERDEARPFEIRDIRKGADGQINVYVREITTP
jgi:hypothetical protein